MDKNGHIYALIDEEKARLLDPITEPSPKDKAKFDEVREDVARLDGYLRGRADSDAPKRGPGANKDLAG